MYLTRFRFNTARVAARRLLSSPQKMHATVLNGFPGLLPSDPDRPRVLWRVDRNARAEVFLYVVSPNQPELTHLVEEAGWPKSDTTWETCDYRPFLHRLGKGDIWAFRLTANPVHYVRTEKGKVRAEKGREETKRTAHLTARHQMGWLLDRQETAGFRIVAKPEEQRRLPEGDEYELVVHDSRRLEFGKGAGKRDRDAKVRLATVTFDGRLEVSDPDALRRTLTNGLGRAKAYGCGLMTLAPVPGKRP